MPMRTKTSELFRSSWIQMGRIACSIMHGMESEFPCTLSLPPECYSSALLRQTFLVLDNKTGRVICVLACPPDDPTWAETHTTAAEYLEENGHRCSFPKRKDKDTGEVKIPRCGNFGALACGISHGGGQTVCSPFLG